MLITVRPSYDGGDTFEVGRVEQKVGKEDLDMLSTAI